MIRRGLAYRGETSPQLFVVTVDEDRYSESWCEGLEIFHNPKALVPLPELYLPGVAHTTLLDGQIVSHHPPFFPVGSMTVMLTPTPDRAGSGS
jgi:hypothetical protein